MKFILAAFLATASAWDYKVVHHERKQCHHRLFYTRDDAERHYNGLGGAFAKLMVDSENTVLKEYGG